MVIKAYSAIETHAGAQIGADEELQLTCENCQKPMNIHPFAQAVPLQAVRSDGNHTVLTFGSFTDYDEPADLVEKMEADGTWPEGYDAVLEPGEGSKMVYIDGWEDHSDPPNIQSWCIQSHEWTEPERICCSEKCCIELAEREGIELLDAAEDGLRWEAARHR
jgi:hypothetical protein